MGKEIFGYPVKMVSDKELGITKNMKKIKFTTDETAFAFVRFTDVPKYYLKHPPEYLREAIRIMQPGDPLHKLLKEELTALHHWKDLPRGNPKAGFKKSQV